jgi:hypothetical protein
LLLTAALFPAVAWGVIALGDYQVSQLDISRWGHDQDIPEALAMDGYRAGHLLPYILAAVVLDFMALLILRAACGPTHLGALGVVLLLAILGSMGIHGLRLWVAWVFAG